MSSNQSIESLFSRFTLLRLRGMDRDNAWFTILALAKSQQLEEANIHSLFKLAKGWEQSQGYAYLDRSVGQKNITIIPDANPSMLKSGQSATFYPPAFAGVELNQILNSEKSEHPKSGYSLSKNNAVQTNTLSESPLAPSLEAVEMLPPEHFSLNSILLLVFDQYPTPIKISVARDQVITIGRITANMAMLPDIDLNQVCADQHGVSRMHANLMRQDNCLLLSDLGSANGTRVNERSLHPHELWVLHDKDELWFAQLHCKIYFWHPPQD